MLIFLYVIITWDVSVTTSLLKTYMEFWGTCFKFLLCPCKASIYFYPHAEKQPKENILLW